MINDDLRLSSPAFSDGEFIPITYTARGEDISPELRLENLCESAVSLAITLDDASHPLFPNYNHWVIWNIPAVDTLKENIPHAAQLSQLGGAIQGVAYGKHCYKGPKPPFKSIHDYVFTVYVLNKMIDLPSSAKRDDLIMAMYDHILQKAILKGKFQSRK